MPTILGSGEHRYRVVENWAKLPDGWSLTDVASVAVDSKDRIYVFNRGAHPMVVLDRDGNFIKSWGEGLFNRAHGLHIDADDNLYCTDDGDHTVRKCSTDGKVLLTIGIPNKPAPFMSGEPFHRCTHTALSPKGEIYVSDGYGNACVHKYTPDGKLMKTWGEPGTDPGQFNIVHNIVDRRRRLGLCRRPREPSRAGVRRQRQIRDAVEQSAPALRAVLLRRQAAEFHHRRTRPRHAGQPQGAESRSAPHHRGFQGQAHRAARRRERARASRPANSWRRTASRWIPRATSMSAKSASPTGRPAFRTRRCRRRSAWCAACRSWRKSSLPRRPTAVSPSARRLPDRVSADTRSAGIG